MNKSINIQDVLNCSMEDNDSGANTLRGYLIALLTTLWEEGEGFSGKRPFGNSGWESDIYKALIQGGFVIGKLDEDGYIDTVDSEQANQLIFEAIGAL